MMTTAGCSSSKNVTKIDLAGEWNIVAVNGEKINVDNMPYIGLDKFAEKGQPPLPPVETFLAQTMAEIVAAGIVVEQVFAIPGLGRLLVASISNRDYPVVQAIVVILAFWVVLSGTLADLVNRCIDPRMGGIGK